MDIIKKGSNGQDVIVKVAHQEELVKQGIRLGRHVEHDPRSRKYAVASPSKLTLKSVMHRILIPVLDQGDLGSCTGNAALACIGAEQIFNKIPAKNKYKPNSDAQKDEGIAIDIYKRATLIDGIQGIYPPEDTGSTGLAVAKVSKTLGLISSYGHAFTLNAALNALMQRPIIIGVNWYEGFDYPDSKGLVKIDGEIRGGHEFCLYGIDATKGLIYARNSWGRGWGLNGSFLFSINDLQRLLNEYGDATIFNPLS